MFIHNFFLEPVQMLALDFAFEAACEELGIGRGSVELASRQRIYMFILKQLRKGETNIDALHRRAVIHFRNTSSPSPL
jgi:hypothetical protein